MSIPFKMIQWNSIDSVVSQSTSVAGFVSIVFVENDQLFLKIMWKCRRVRIAKKKKKRKENNTEKFICEISRLVHIYINQNIVVLAHR